MGRSMVDRVSSGGGAEFHNRHTDPGVPGSVTWYFSAFHQISIFLSLPFKGTLFCERSKHSSVFMDFLFNDDLPEAFTSFVAYPASFSSHVTIPYTVSMNLFIVK